MSAERQKRIYEGISAVRDALPTETTEEFLHGLLRDLEKGIATKPGLTVATIRYWLGNEAK